MRSEKGAITLYVSIVCLFILIVGVIAYIGASNKQAVQMAELNKIEEQYKNPDYYQWAIVLKDIDEPIGSISVVDINEKCEMVTIGYCIGQKWWHQGVTSEAFKAVIDYLFESVEVNRIEAKHDTNNPNSGKVMKKCGLKYEGTLRQAGFNNYGIVDESIYGLLRSEWKR